MLSLIQQWFVFCGALLGFVGLAAGAFGAHILQQRLAPESLTIFEVGVRYQMYHALAILLTVLLMSVIPGYWPMMAGYFFISGTIIFSGSLYILVFSGVKAWGAVTPIGGVLLLLGWISLTLMAFAQRS